jgi:hypothetical protein
MIRCPVCRLRPAKRRKIELELLAGQILQLAIARRHKLPLSSLRRHKAHHIEPDTVLEEIARLRAREAGPVEYHNPYRTLLDLQEKLRG